MLPMHKIYSSIFKTFTIDWDTKIISELKKDKIKNAIVIKRSWIYWLMASWVLLATIILTVINIYNSYQLFQTDWLRYTIIWVLAFSCLSLVLSSLAYLYNFKQLYNDDNKIMPVSFIEEELQQWDHLFTRFFNSITTNIFLFTLLVIFHVVHLWMNFAWWNFSIKDIWFTILDVWLLIAQLYLMRKYRRTMINLEMDFNVVLPGRIIFVNQSNMMSSTQSLLSDKIKTIKSDTTNFFLSFFNLGKVTVLTEWDQGAVGIMEMHYVANPWNTVKNISKVMDEQVVYIENNYLKKILQVLSIKEKYWDLPENFKEIVAFIEKNDSEIKRDYEKWDLIEREEIKNLYTLIYELKKKI